MLNLKNNKLLIHLLGSLTLAIFALLLATQFHLSYAGDKNIKVFKSPTCGCCTKWVEHMEKNGFHIESVDTQRMDIVKKQYGVPGNLQSCHTAIIGDYVIEGHVPAKEIDRLLKLKSPVRGLAVPGMPMGSPGMEGFRKDKYSVVSFDKDGKTEIFANY